MTTADGDSSICPLLSTIPNIEESLVRDEQTNELYLPLTSAVILKRKQKILFLSVDFKNNLTKDNLVDLEAYVSAFA